MHPFQTAELARLRRADLLHEADQARLAARARRASRSTAHDLAPEMVSRTRLAMIGIATVIIASVAMVAGGIVPLDLIGYLRLR
jgi:hypothetical protein